MAYLTHIRETRTDPADTILTVDSEEVEEAVIEIMKDEGITPNTVYLTDEYSQEDIEIDVNDYLCYEELATLEAVHIKEEAE